VTTASNFSSHGQDNHVAPWRVEPATQDDPSTIPQKLVALVVLTAGSVGFAWLVVVPLVRLLRF
jgi:hypothetical protein